MSAQLIPFGRTARFLTPAQRAPLTGGVLDQSTAITLMNSHFFVSMRDGEVGIWRIEDDGTITYLPSDQFALLLANIFVQVGGKTISIAKFWLTHRDRRSCRRIVFDPSGNIHPDDYNLWRGFAVTPKAGFRKQRRLLHHIYRIICRRDKTKFKYLIKYLAWTVQNPHRHAEVVVVFKSDAEGCGKSTVGTVMLDIFGAAHGLLVDNKEQLLGTFNPHLEITCFVLGEEVLWAGDAKTADRTSSPSTKQVISRWGLKVQLVLSTNIRARRRGLERGSCHTLRVTLEDDHHLSVAVRVLHRPSRVLD